MGGATTLTPCRRTPSEALPWRLVRPESPSRPFRFWRWAMKSVKARPEVRLHFVHQESVPVHIPPPYESGLDRVDQALIEPGSRFSFRYTKGERKSQRRTVRLQQWLADDWFRVWDEGKQEVRDYLASETYDVDYLGHIVNARARRRFKDH